MTRIIVVLISGLLLGCRSNVHKWQFEIKNEGRFPDAYHIKTTFTPVRYRISIKGNLSDSSRLYQNIYSSNSNEMSSHSTRLASGNIEFSGGGDIYEDNLTLIYIPGSETKTVGKLLVTVEID